MTGSALEVRQIILGWMEKFWPLWLVLSLCVILFLIIDYLYIRRKIKKDRL